MMYAVVRIRGTMETDRRAEDTMRMMRLSSANSCVLVQEDAVTKGMLQRAKDYVTWGEVPKEVVAQMLRKRLRARSQSRRVDDAKLKELTGFESFESFSEALVQGGTRLKDHPTLDPVLRLTPPSKGMRSVKHHFPDGDLGYRGEKIYDLIKRMI